MSGSGSIRSGRVFGGGNQGDPDEPEVGMRKRGFGIGSRFGRFEDGTRERTVGVVLPHDYFPTLKSLNKVERNQVQINSELKSQREFPKFNSIQFNSIQFNLKSKVTSFNLILSANSQIMIFSITQAAALRINNDIFQ